MKRALLAVLIAVGCLASSAGAAQMLPVLDPDYDYGYSWGPCPNPAWNPIREAYGSPSWDGEGKVELPNLLDWEETKHVWMAVTYNEEWLQGDWDNYYSDPLVEYQSDSDPTAWIMDIPTDSWWEDTVTVWYHWHLSYQPERESIILPDESYYWLCEWPAIYQNATGEQWMYPHVTDVSFYTWCTPEPATMSLLAIGGLFALKRRRK